MKKNAPGKYSLIRFFVIICVFLLSLSSCEEGLFNFNEETGNISLSLTADSVSTRLGTIVFTLENDDTGDNLEKVVEIEDHGDIQEASCYISRVNIGSWKIKAEVYDVDQNPLTTCEDKFELELGQTVIAKLGYWDGDVLDLFFAIPTGEELVSIVQFDSLDTIIIGEHYAPGNLDLTHFTSTMIATGSGFDKAMTGLIVGYPDGSYFEYSSGGSRSVSGIEVEVQSNIMSITRSDFSDTGNYSLTSTDLNGVEKTVIDNYWFDDPVGTGFISFGGDDYVGGQVPDTMWEINDAAANSSVFAYIVNREIGTDVSENTGALIVRSVGSLDPAVDDFSFAGAAILDVSQIVLVTIDIDETTADAVINDATDPGFVKGATNLSISNLPGWLYSMFGEDLNFIGISVWEYNT